MRGVRFSIGLFGCVLLGGLALAQVPEEPEERAAPVTPPTLSPPQPYAQLPHGAPHGYYAAPMYPLPAAPAPFALPPRYDANTTPYTCNSVEGLIARWKATKEADRPKVEASLRQELQREFRDSLAIDEQRVKLAEAEAKKLRERLELRHNKQDDIIDFRMQQLLREAQGIGWEHDFPSPLPPISWYSPDEAAPVTVSCVAHPLPTASLPIPPQGSVPVMPTLRK